MGGVPQIHSPLLPHPHLQTHTPVHNVFYAHTDTVSHKCRMMGIDVVSLGEYAVCEWYFRAAHNMDKFVILL